MAQGRAASVACTAQCGRSSFSLPSPSLPLITSAPSPYTAPPISPRSAPPLLHLRAAKRCCWELQEGAALRQALVWHELPRRAATLDGLLGLPAGAGFDFTGVVLKVGQPHRGGCSAAGWLVG